MHLKWLSVYLVKEDLRPLDFLRSSFFLSTNTQPCLTMKELISTISLFFLHSTLHLCPRNQADLTAPTEQTFSCRRIRNRFHLITLLQTNKRSSLIPDFLHREGKSLPHSHTQLIRKGFKNQVFALALPLCWTTLEEGRKDPYYEAHNSRISSLMVKRAGIQFRHNQDLSFPNQLLLWFCQLLSAKAAEHCLW